MNTNIENKRQPLLPTTAPLQSNKIIELPFLDLALQHKIYRAFQLNYNHTVRLRRKPIREELKQIRETLGDPKRLNKLERKQVLMLQLDEQRLKHTLSTEPYQTLKESHMAMMFELTRRIVQQQRQYNKDLGLIGGAKTVAGEPYILHTNNAELAHNKMACESRTMLNHRNRLEVAGFILGTEHQGRTKDFEMAINGRFLAFFDVKDTEYRPEYALLPETVTSGLRPLSSESFSTKGKQIEHINTSITPVKGICYANGSNALAGENGHEKNEHTELKTVPEKLAEANEAKVEAPSWLQAKRTFESQGGRAALHRWRAQFTGLKAYKMAAIYYLLIMAKDKLWPTRSINWTVMERVAEGIYENWYALLPSEPAKIEATLGEHLKAVDRQKKYLDFQAKQGLKAFTLLPDQFFAFQKDVMEQCNQKNFSTFHAQLVRNRALAKQTEARKLGQLRWKLNRFFDDTTAQYFADPTLSNFKKTMKALKDRHPVVGEEMAAKFQKKIIEAHAA